MLLPSSGFPWCPGCCPGAGKFSVLGGGVGLTLPGPQPHPAPGVPQTQMDVDRLAERMHHRASTAQGMTRPDHWSFQIRRDLGFSRLVKIGKKF